MSSEAHSTSPDAAFLAGHAQKIAEDCSSDLTTLLGRAIGLRPAGIERIPLDAVAERDDPIVDQLCRTSEEPGADVHLLMPLSSALRVASLQLGESGEDVANGELDVERRAAFQAVSKVVASNLSRAFEEAGLASIVARDAQAIPEPASDPTWLVGERFLRLRFEFEMEGLPSGQLDVLLGDAGGESESETAERTIYILSDGEAEPPSLEELGAQLGWCVASISPEKLRAEGSAVFANAGAIVVPWEVSGRAGLELLDGLLRDEQTADVPILMSSEAPTRAMVSAALRAGARSFVMRPYEGEELCSRLRERKGGPGTGDTTGREAGVEPDDGAGSDA